MLHWVTFRKLEQVKPHIIQVSGRIPSPRFPDDCFRTTHLDQVGSASRPEGVGGKLFWLQTQLGCTSFDSFVQQINGERATILPEEHWALTIWPGDQKFCHAPDWAELSIISSWD